TMLTIQPSTPRLLSHASRIPTASAAAKITSAMVIGPPTLDWGIEPDNSRSRSVITAISAMYFMGCSLMLCRGACVSTSADRRQMHDGSTSDIQQWVAWRMEVRFGPGADVAKAHNVPTRCATLIPKELWRGLRRRGGQVPCALPRRWWCALQTAA